MSSKGLSWSKMVGKGRALWRILGTDPGVIIIPWLSFPSFS